MGSVLPVVDPSMYWARDRKEYTLGFSSRKSPSLRTSKSQSSRTRGLPYLSGTGQTSMIATMKFSAPCFLWESKPAHAFAQYLWVRGSDAPLVPAPTTLISNERKSCLPKSRNVSNTSGLSLSLYAVDWEIPPLRNTDKLDGEWCFSRASNSLFDRDNRC